MNTNRHGLWHYLKAAFHARVPVPGLGKMPANYIGLGAFAVLGLANPGFWLIGLGLEAAYLLSLSLHDRFRHAVDSELFAEDRERAEIHWESAEQELCEADRQRLQRLRARCERVQAYSTKLGSDLDSVDAWSLASLQVIYSKLLRTQEVLGAQVRSVSLDELNTQLNQAVDKRAALPADEFRLVQTYDSTIEILKKRIENLKQAQAKLTYIAAELTRIEQQVELVADEAALAKQPDHLASYIDSVVQTFSETKQWLSSESGISEQEVDAEAARVVKGIAQQR